MSITPGTIAHRVALAIVCIACVVHLASNVDHRSTHCERWGFVLCGAGAFGEAAYLWTSHIEPWDFGLTMHVGMALIALNLISGRVRAIIASMPGMRWTDRRRS